MTTLVHACVFNTGQDENGETVKVEVLGGEEQLNLLSAGELNLLAAATEEDIQIEMSSSGEIQAILPPHHQPQHHHHLQLGTLAEQQQDKTEQETTLVEESLNLGKRMRTMDFNQG